MKGSTAVKSTVWAALVVAAVVAVGSCGTDDNSGAGASTATEAVAPAGDAQGMSGAESGAADPGIESTDDDAGSAAGLSFDAAGFSCATGTLRSSGSTAQGKVMAALIVAYNEKCGATINDYGGGGSGQGITDFLAHQTDFGGSDSAMTADQLAQAKTERCAGNDAVNLPMVTGPIAVAYHLSDVDRLVLTPEVLSGIFGGTITTWNAPAIAAVNPGVALPDLAITTVHRSEDSGTTDNFTRYLAAAGDWTFPGGKAWTAPGGVGAQGSDGVSKAVASTEGSIGYVEWGYAQQEDLAMAEIDNGSGPVALTAESAGAAVQAATITASDAGAGEARGDGVAGPDRGAQSEQSSTASDQDLALTLDYATDAPGAYPVILVTYELVCTGGNGDQAELLRSFLGFAATDGQSLFVDLGAAPLPADIQAKVVDAIQGIG